MGASGRTSGTVAGWKTAPGTVGASCERDSMSITGPVTRFCPPRRVGISAFGRAGKPWSSASNFLACNNLSKIASES